MKLGVSKRAPLNAPRFWRRLVVSFGCFFGSRTNNRDAPPHKNAIAIECSLLSSAPRLKYQRSGYFQGGESADRKLAENAMTYVAVRLFVPCHYLGHETSYYEFSTVFWGKTKSGSSRGRHVQTLRNFSLAPAPIVSPSECTWRGIRARHSRLAGESTGCRRVVRSRAPTSR